ncbi:MAG: GtrA family protein [Magnetococcales bacterium]|nr:GtrA family protein [Magnetococcales bacterium]MBF0321898.1 GtrA family protein [Magnetococcales bacterium]
MLLKIALGDLWRQHQNVIRYLIGGAYNTLFGFLFFAGIYYLFADVVHYLLLSVVSQVASVTNAFLVYRLFVFKSKGNALREYVRFYLVYGVSFIVGIVSMWIMVEVFAIHPIVSQLLILLSTVTISYFGHKNFSFKG